MNDAGERLSEFGGPDVVSTMISHTTFSALLESQEIEHHGVLQTLRELADDDVPLDDPLVATVLSHSDFVNFAFWSEEEPFIESATEVVRGQQTYDKTIRDGFWNRAWTWLGDFDVESEHSSTPGQRLPDACASLIKKS